MSRRHWPTPVQVALLAALGAGLSGVHAQMPVLDGQNMQLTLGESQVLQLPQPVSRVAVGHPGIADAEAAEAARQGTLLGAMGASVPVDGDADEDDKGPAA